MTTAPRYWAFISYSHRDAAVAAQLQRDLEDYRVPPRLVGRSTAAGALPRQLKPVYRDRDELRAGADLSAPIAEALAASRFLIVVCSPDAARSRWVEQEIVAFKRLHGEAGAQRVLALIARGEPFAERRPDGGEECLPAPLRRALDADGRPTGAPLEPVAADLRPHADGRRLATLKLLAAILDVELDALVRRDLRRRVRLLGVAATLATFGMVVLAGLAFVATQARDEARTRRAEAENLIEFMLGDLRKKLEPVGRLDVLDAVGVRALAHYDAQPLATLDAGALGRRARAQHLIGEIGELRGNLDEALASFRSAAATTAVALARAPRDGQRVYDHAQSVFWVGWVAFKRGEVDAAERAFDEYRALAERLRQIDARNADWQIELAYAHQNLGVLRLLKRARPADALRDFEATTAVYRGLIAARPALAFELADALGWIANARNALGDLDGAIGALHERRAVLERMPDAERNRKVQQAFADNAYQVAGLELDRGHVDAARASVARALEQATPLVALDGTNTFWRSQAALYRMRRAEIDLAQGRLDAVRAELDDVAREVEATAAKDASVVVWQVSLRGRLLALKAALAERSREPPPLAELLDYVARVPAFETGGKRLDAAQTRDVAAVEVALGDAQARSGRRELADAPWRSAAQRLRALGAGATPNQLAVLALAESRLGHGAEVAELARRLNAAHYRHPAHAELLNPSRGAGAERSPS